MVQVLSEWSEAIPVIAANCLITDHVTAIIDTGGADLNPSRGQPC